VKTISALNNTIWFLSESPLWPYQSPHSVDYASELWCCVALELLSGEAARLTVLLVPIFHFLYFCSVFSRSPRPVTCLCLWTWRMIDLRAHGLIGGYWFIALLDCWIQLIMNVYSPVLTIISGTQWVQINGRSLKMSLKLFYHCTGIWVQVSVLIYFCNLRQGVEGPQAIVKLKHHKNHTN